MKKVTSIAAAVALAAGAIATGAAAYGDNVGTLPPYCSITAVKPSIQTVSGKARVRFGGTASCIESITNYFRLVHNYNGLPDALVKEYQTTVNPYTYYGTTCDNGPASTQYYSEVGWYTQNIGNVQRVSSTVTLSHC